MGLIDLPEIEDYFQGGFSVCPIKRQAMTPGAHLGLGRLGSCLGR